MGWASKFEDDNDKKGAPCGPIVPQKWLSKSSIEAARNKHEKKQQEALRDLATVALHTAKGKIRDLELDNHRLRKQLQAFADELGRQKSIITTEMQKKVNEVLGDGAKRAAAMESKIHEKDAKLQELEQKLNDYRFTEFKGLLDKTLQSPDAQKDSKPSGKPSGKPEQKATSVKAGLNPLIPNDFRIDSMNGL